MGESFTQYLKLALMGAHYTPFALAAYGVFLWRIVRRKLGRAELGLILLFVAVVLLELLQFRLTGRSLDEPNGFAAFSRYLAPAAPLLWIFAAKGASSFWCHRNADVRSCAKVILAIALGWVFFKENVGQVINYKLKIQAHDTEVAVAQLAPKILEDYLGPREQRTFVRRVDEYYTGRRPVVTCPFGAAGWAVRGDHCRATTGAEGPYREDYLCLPLGSRFGGITNIDVRVYKYIATVPGGLETQWMLFRRRLTPGRKQ